MSEQNDSEIIMPFGEYKGSQLSDIPPDYLLWLYKQEWLKGPIKAYIFNNMDDLNAKNAINNKKNFDYKYYFKK